MKVTSRSGAASTQRREGARFTGPAISLTRRASATTRTATAAARSRRSSRPRGWSKPGGGERQRIRPGGVVMAPPEGVHRRGAGAGTAGPMSYVSIATAEIEWQGGGPGSA